MLPGPILVLTVCSPQDKFEDAVDTTEVRTLTKRTTSSFSTQQLPESPPESPLPVEEAPVKKQEVVVEEEQPAAATTPTTERAEPLPRSSPSSNRISNTSNLDTVSLDDDSNPIPPQTKPLPPPKPEEPG